MFRNTIINRIAIGAVAGVLALASCSDDHFDVKTTGTSTSTIWENIEQTSGLDSLKMILNKAYFMRSERDASFDYTYADVLNTNDVFTLWAPVDGSYNASAILAQLDAAAAAHESGDVATALSLYRSVEMRFVRNHMARFSYSSVTSSVDVNMFNDKVSTFDVAGGTFASVALSGNAASGIASSNGAFYTIGGQVAFRNNLYEFIMDDAANAELASYLAKFDTTYFSESSSTAGATYNGEIQYVDSAFVSYNKRLRSTLSVEDSSFIGVVPTWSTVEQFRDKFADYLKYKNSYKSNYSTDTRLFTQDVEVSDPDSMHMYNATQAWLNYMAYSSRNFPVANWKDSAQIISYAVGADSLRSFTSNSYLYNTNPGESNPYFGTSTPQRLSNGYAFTVDSLALASRMWLDNLTYSLLYASNVLYSRTGDTGELVTLTDANRNDSIEGDLEFSSNTYRKFSYEGGYPQIVFRIPATYSIKHKIGIITVPLNINTDDITTGVASPTATVRARLLDDTNSAIATSGNLTTSATAVDTLMLFDDIDLPYTYQGLPEGISSFLRLEVTVRLTSPTRQGINIAGVIIRPSELDD